MLLHPKNTTQEEQQMEAYISTYGLYNTGSPKGDWFDLDLYDDQEELDDALEVFFDGIDDDPEYMYQDFEGFPDSYYNESGLSSEFWEYKEMVNDGVDKDMLAAGAELGIPLGSIQDAYRGEFDTVAEFANDWLDGTGELDDDSVLARYFDYEKYGRDLAMDFSEFNGHYFLTDW